MKTRIGLLFGGVSTEHEVSLRSARSIYEAFDHSQFEVLPIGVDKKGGWHFFDRDTFLTYSQRNEIPHIIDEEGSQVPAVKEMRQAIDVIFPIIHGKHGEDGALQGLLTILNVPYVGPDVLSSAVSMDKDFSKQIVQKSGITVTKYIVLRSWDTIDENAWKEFAFPLFVKPARTGSSVGVSCVHSNEEAKEAIHRAFTYDDKVVVEEGIDGIELEVSVLGNETIEVSVPGRILPSDSYYSYNNKVNDGALFEIPAQISEADRKRVQSVAREAYRALNCEGMARIDLFLGSNGEVYFNEANTLPGFTATSLYPMLWKASGKPYTQLLTELIALAKQRHARKEKHVLIP